MRYLLIFLMIIFLSGCVTSVNYDLREKTITKQNEAILIDSRVNPKLESYGERHAKMYVGDKSLKPTVLEIVSSAFYSNLKDYKFLVNEKLELSKFDLLVFYPNKFSQMAGMGMAGSSYAGAILMQNALAPDGKVHDSVILNMSILYNATTYSCESIVEADKEIDELFGYGMNGIPIQAVFLRAIEDCAKKIISDAGLNTKFPSKA